MHIGSETTAPKRSTEPSPLVANFVGTAIALITLVLPLVVIAHYTPESPPLPPPARIAN